MHPYFFVGLIVVGKWLLVGFCVVALLAWLLPYVPARGQKFVGALTVAVGLASILPLVPMYCCWCAEHIWCPCYGIC